MKRSVRRNRLGMATRFWLGLALAPIGVTAATSPPPQATSMAHIRDHVMLIGLGTDQLSIRFVAPGIVHVQNTHGDAANAPSLAIDHDAAHPVFEQVRTDANGASMTTARASVHWDEQHRQLRIDDAQRHPLLQLDLSSLQHGGLTLQHEPQDALYGIGGYNATEDAAAGLLRTGKQVAGAGEQGHAGAPFVWSTAGYGVLLDSDGATFTLKPGAISVDNDTHRHPDYYILIGTPADIFAALTQLSGRSPLFPKWAMGFTNSQWGIDQKELLQIVDTYRAKHIPIDNFTLDFDWKAWGEDNYGEFRWNATKFPDAPSGKLKSDLDRRGVHLTGIMKPRVHVDTVEGRYATAHDLWRPDEKAAPDYFSLKLVKDIDFDKPAARAWFFNDALKQSFATGIAGWWNDEADNTPSNTQFLNMQRTLYDGQRAISNQRVWSVNRNFWLGSQRYAYGLWSGDILTGFASMAGQRARMLSAINVGAMQWGMDGGGFHGHPSDENYARWIEFGAFTPIFRVHGDFGQKRQPWVYGPVAEKAAADAIRLRYLLIPYIYSYEHARRAHGVGLVRPLLFDWPHDPQLRNDVDAWLFGDWLLASPVVEPGQTSKDVYLPAGRWTDWFSGKAYPGGQTVRLAIDSKHWGDIPLFIRDGAIIPTQPPMDYVGEKPLTQLEVDVFPADARTQFDYYDDDGNTYDYEKGAYFAQSLSVQRQGHTVRFGTGAVSGSFKPALKSYLLKIHGGAAATVRSGGTGLPPFQSLDALQHSQGEGWASGHDRYGAVTYVRVMAATVRDIALTLGDNG